MIFEDRFRAGEALADAIEARRLKPVRPIILGIPRGGVAVGKAIAGRFNWPMEALSLRKLPIPSDPEMGFGAVTLDKKTILNEALVSHGLIPKEEIERIIDEVYKEVLRRDKAYRGDEPFPTLKGRSVFIVDDGLATGYTMLAAIKYAKEKGAASVIAAVPVAHFEAFNLVKKEADEVICLHKSMGFSFAVASFYESFPDMKDKEVIDLLEKG